MNTTSPNEKILRNLRHFREDLYANISRMHMNGERLVDIKAVELHAQDMTDEIIEFEILVAKERDAAMRLDYGMPERE